MIVDDKVLRSLKDLKKYIILQLQFCVLAAGIPQQSTDYASFNMFIK